MTPLVEQIDQTVRPLLTEQGYDLVLIEHEPRGHVLRFFIDREPQVGIDDCSQVSRYLSDVLDAEGLTDLIEGAFNLEVSSPGLDRPLVRPDHYIRFVGSEVKVALTDAKDGRRKIQGRLARADAQEIEVKSESDGASMVLRYDDIQKARIVPSF